MRVYILKEKLDALANAIGIKAKRRVPQTIDDLTETVETCFELQGKSVSKPTEPQTVEADEGYYGLSNVEIEPLKLEDASVSLNADGQTIYPAIGYDAMRSVTVWPASLAGTVGVNAGYYTSSGQLRWRLRGYYNIAQSGWRDRGTLYSSYTNYPAIASGTTVTPTESAQTIGGTNTMMQGAVTVNPIPSEYIIPTGTKSITQNGTGIDVSEYASVDVSVSGGGSPTLQTKTYTVDSAGTETITADSGYDGLQEVDVVVPSVGMQSQVILNSVPSISVDSLTGEVTAEHYVDDMKTPVYQDGWAETSANIQFVTHGTASYQLSTQSATTITPSESTQTAVASGKYTTGAVTVNPIPSDYVNLPKFTVDLTASPATATCNKTYAECVSLYNNDYKASAVADVTTQYNTTRMAVSAVEYQQNAYLRYTMYSELGVPAIDLTYYPNGTINVTNPSAMLIEVGSPTATKGSVSNHSVSITPSVTNVSGYINSGTKTGTAVTVTASELVSGDLAITQNGSNIDCANYSTVSVNVPSSGGSEWTHIAHTTVTVNTTSTSAGSAGTVSCGTSIVDKNKIIYVRIRDQEGARAGYFAGSDAYFMNYNKANGSTSAFAVPAVLCYRYTTSSAWAGTAGQYGVYGYSISNAGVLTVRRRYNSSYSLTINSTYDVDVFTLDYPSGYPAAFDL